MINYGMAIGWYLYFKLTFVLYNVTSFGNIQQVHKVGASNALFNNLIIHGWSLTR